MVNCCIGVLSDVEIRNKMKFYQFSRIFLTLIIITIHGHCVSGQSRRSAPPRILTQPEVFVVPYATEYPNVTLPCRADGFPMPQIQWTFNKQALDGDEYESLSDGSLLFYSVQPTFAGYYECRATNRFGESRVMHNLIVYRNLDEDSTSHWTYHHIHKFINTSIVSTTDTTITLARRKRDTSPLNIFYKPSDEKDEGERKVRMSPSMSEYTLEDLQCGTMYQIYTIYDSRHVLYVRTKGKYGIPPTKDKFIRVGENSVALDFNAWEDTSCPNTKFTVKYKPAFLESVEGWITEADSISPTGNYNISGLSSNTSYILRIEVHLGQNSTTHKFKFNTQQPFINPPLPFSMILLGDKQVNLVKSSILDFYKVVCWVPDNSSKVIWINPKNKTVEGGSFRLSAKYVSVPFGLAVEFKIDKVTENDNGLYSCLSSTGEKESFNLHVKDGSKKFSTSLSEQIAYEGTEYCLKCAENFDYSVVSWTINYEREILPPKYTKRKFNGNLCIRNVTKLDSTQKYHCSVKFPDLKTRQIKLTVLSQPWLSDEPETRIWAVLGNYVNLTCAALDANPAPEFQWGRDKITTNPRPAYTILSPNDKTSILTVILSNDSIQSPFTCQARNKVGVAEIKFTLHRAFRPPPPAIQLDVAAFNGARIKVDERLPQNQNHAPISQYVVLARIVNNENWEVPITPWNSVAAANVSKRFDGFDLNTLMSDTTYQVKVACKNVANLMSDYSGIITLKTDVITDWSLPLEFKAAHLFAFASTTDSKIIGGLGKWVELHCVMFADPPIKIEWKKHNRTIVENHAIKINNTTPNKSVLKVFLKHLTSFGDYICYSRRGREMKEWTVNIEMPSVPMDNTIAKIEPLTIVPAERVVFVHQESSYLISCQSADGSNNLRWFDKNGRQIGTSSRSRTYVVPSPGMGMDLVFSRIVIEDSGTYHCRNSQHNIPLQLNVYQKPEFHEQQTTYWFSNDKLANLTCAVDATPPATISWDCNKHFDKNETTVFNVEENKSIIQVKVTDEEKYWSTFCYCIVDHELERKTRVIKLERGLDKPQLAFQSFIKTNEKTGRSQRVSYLVKANYILPHLEIIGFDVQYRDYNDGMKNDDLTSGWKVIGYEQYTSSNGDRGLITGQLKPGAYQIRVATKAHKAQSAFSEPIFVRIYDQ